MTNDPGHARAGDDDDVWFHDPQVVDPEWLEFSLTTPVGNQVRYRVPQRTLFEEMDQECPN
jgi:hypothetical protein